MNNKNSASLRKRSQIAKANKMMFVWVAAASVIVSASAVLVIMMVQKGFHNQKAISKLGQTVKTIELNNENVSELENQLRALGSNAALLKLRNNDAVNALSVVLDALPAESNPSALGASFQRRLFKDVSVESIEVTPAGEGESGAGDESDEAASSDNQGAQAINFQFTVEGSPSRLRALMKRLEQSIRTIQLTSVKIESDGSRQSLSAEGVAYYLPAKTLELRNEEVKR